MCRERRRWLMQQAALLATSTFFPEASRRYSLPPRANTPSWRNARDSCGCRWKRGRTSIPAMCSEALTSTTISPQVLTEPRLHKYDDMKQRLTVLAWCVYRGQSFFASLSQASHGHRSLLRSVWTARALRAPCLSGHRRGCHGGAMDRRRTRPSRAH
jgi:hypothetical protein